MVFLFRWDQQSDNAPRGVRLSSPPLRISDKPDFMKSRYYQTDLGSVHYLDSCSLDIQETIVFLHGLLVAVATFRNTRFQAAYRCLMDLPGHGQT